MNHRFTTTDTPNRSTTQNQWWVVYYPIKHITKAIQINDELIKVLEKLIKVLEKSRC